VSALKKFQIIGDLRHLLHYRIRLICREPDTPGKGYFAPGKAFAGSCTRQRASGKNLAGKDFFAGSFYRAPGKDFAESKHGPRQRKVTVTAPVPSVLSLPGAVSETPGKDF